ncbi:hypothetical protein D3C81_670240 [compost metagenome]
MGRQLGHGHHALGNHMPEPCGVVGGEPTQWQLCHLGANVLAAALQHRYRQTYAGLFHLASPGPAQRHAGGENGQPGTGSAYFAVKQVQHERRQGTDGQATEYPVQHGHQQVTAPCRCAFAQQSNEGFQHAGSAFFTVF